MIYCQLMDLTNADMLYSITQILIPEESGVYAVINKKTDKAKPFPFMSEHSSLFFLKLEQMSAKHFEKKLGYELWHQRLGHASF
jgi:hypothetical protein